MSKSKSNELKEFASEGLGEVSDEVKRVSSDVFEEVSEFTDKEILCVDCDENFIWSAGEQTFFRDKGLKNAPKRCKDCKKAKNERLTAILSAQNSGIKQRIEVLVNCAKCEAQTTVPFYPSQGRPVYCRSCYLEINPSILKKHNE